MKPVYRAMRTDLDVTKIKVDVRRLDTILADHAPDVHRVDIISVDVEGLGARGAGRAHFDSYRPTVVIVDNLLAIQAMRERFVIGGMRLEAVGAERRIRHGVGAVALATCCSRAARAPLRSAQANRGSFRSAVQTAARLGAASAAQRVLRDTERVGGGGELIAPLSNGRIVSERPPARARRACARHARPT